MKKEKILSDAVLIALAPLIGYLLLLFFYDGAESNLRLPSGIGSVDIYQSIQLGFIIAFIVALAYWISEVLSRIIPARTSLLTRIRRIVQVSTLLGFCFTVAATQGATFVKVDLDFLKSFAVLSLVASVPFIIRDIVLPTVKHRKIKKIEKRLRKSRPDNLFVVTRRYYASFLTALNLAFLFVPLILLNTVAYNAGKASTATDKGREYIIIESNPKQIVLINYGDRWVAANYDDSYPGKPAYRQEYSIIEKADMSKNKFTVKYIPSLYIYD